MFLNHLGRGVFDSHLEVDATDSLTDFVDRHPARDHGLCALIIIMFFRDFRFRLDRLDTSELHRHSSLGGGVWFNLNFGVMDHRIISLRLDRLCLFVEVIASYKGFNGLLISLFILVYIIPVFPVKLFLNFQVSLFENLAERGAHFFAAFWVQIGWHIGVTGR